MPTIRADFEALAATLTENNSLVGSVATNQQWWIDKVAELMAKPNVTSAELRALHATALDTKKKITDAIIAGTPAATVPDNPPPVEPPVEPPPA